MLITPVQQLLLLDKHGMEEDTTMEQTCKQVTTPKDM